MATSESYLFPPLEPNRSGKLSVDEIHTLYWEECGNPKGIPVIFLHGGPGAGISATSRRFFNPEFYRIFLFDQRGSGQSTPLGEYKNNTTQLLIEDIERFRNMLHIDQWLVFGGSWGSTLSLAYSQAHPDHCLGLILRGIWLISKAELDWWLYGLEAYYPEAWKEFADFIPEAERKDLLKAYSARLFSNNVPVALAAAKKWSRYEGSCLHLLPRPDVTDAFTTDAIAIGVGRLEAHYFNHQGFLEENQLLNHAYRIKHLPCFIVQGRYDMICPPKYALALHRVLPESKFVMVPDGGHSAYEPGIAEALVQATEEFRVSKNFKTAS